VPPEYRERRDAYVALLVDELIPMVAAERLAACCDVFVEESARISSPRAAGLSSPRQGSRRWRRLAWWR
jgi:imidazolonepropionase-like amidohydrolase